MLKLIYLIMQQNQISTIFHILILCFALKSYFGSLKTEVDKLDIDKLEPVPVELS